MLCSAEAIKWEMVMHDKKPQVDGKAEICLDDDDSLTFSPRDGTCNSDSLASDGKCVKMCEVCNVQQELCPRSRKLLQPKTCHSSVLP